jgi:3-methyl-2-oxobutanoate hydroxymethyltransferase
MATIVRGRTQVFLSSLGLRFARGTHTSGSSSYGRLRPVTTRTVREAGRRGTIPLVMVTAYDYPSGLHADRAGVDIVLVGDSLGMVVLGHRTTQPVTLEDMLHHCAATRRGVTDALLVADMPFGAYETSAAEAMRGAYRLIKEARVDAVKLEGGSPARCKAVSAIVEGGVAVMGHVGLTPQAVSVAGGFRSVGRDANAAAKVLDEALALQEAGAFAIVLECVPGPVAQVVSDALEIPTIGIGAGAGCRGQVLVYHDLLGMMAHPHHTNVAPKFSKQYACLGNVVDDAIRSYADEVRAGTFPSEQYSPYRIPDEELENFTKYAAAKQIDAPGPDLRGDSGRSEGTEATKVY